MRFQISDFGFRVGPWRRCFLTLNAQRSTLNACRLPLALLLPLVLLALAGCHVDMWTQPKVHKPLQASEFFPDGSSARPAIPGTVARQASPADLKLGNPFHTGIGTDGKLLDELPKEVPLTRENLKRGQQRFEIYCTPCHGRLGDGKGMIATRGLALRKQPGNYHTAKLRKMPLGHFYDVITNGFGAMYSYSTRVEPADRWRIAAYIRVLQASHNVPATSLPADKLAELNTTAEAVVPEPHATAVGAH
jgi:mono/diheme cytochrome c family protein